LPDSGLTRPVEMTPVERLFLSVVRTGSIERTTAVVSTRTPQLMASALAALGVSVWDEKPRALTNCAWRARLHQLLTNLLRTLSSPAMSPSQSPWPCYKGTAGRRHSTQRGSSNPQALIPKLFDPLVRGENISGPQTWASLGLGLCIAHSIAAAHGGRIDVDSATPDGLGIRLCSAWPLH
jgi:C4-dicarboxylate-specific signal transduction histidine kinase